MAVKCNTCFRTLNDHAEGIYYCPVCQRHTTDYPPMDEEDDMDEAIKAAKRMAKRLGIGVTGQGE